VRDDTAQPICLCKFGKEGNLRADPCSRKTYDGRFLGRAVVPNEIVVLLHPNGFTTFVGLRSGGECSAEHSSQTYSTSIKASEDKSMSAGLGMIELSHQ